LVYSTCIGGTGDELVYGMAVDADNNVYLTGLTFSLDYPSTTGAYQVASGGGYADIFVTKLNADGTDLTYSTFLGGSDWDEAYALELDLNNNVYLAGDTWSTDYPVTASCYQPANGGWMDGVLTVLNASGSDINYSTYIGGSDFDEGRDLALDDLQNVILYGNTYSDDFQTTEGCFQGSLLGYPNCFLTKLDLTSIIPVFSTYIGGSVGETGTTIALDNGGNVYLTGNTWSNDYPWTTGSPHHGYGNLDGFVSKLNPTATSLVYSTFIGGTSNDYLEDITVDAAGYAYVTGYTWSMDYPVTAGVYKGAMGDYQDGVVTKLDIFGSSLAYSTYIGGSNSDWINGITLDSEGNLYFTGGTASLDFPVTPDALPFDPNVGMWDYDCILGTLNSSGTALLYSTYLAGQADDEGYEIALDNSMNIYVAGITISDDFPITEGAWQPSHDLGTSFDVFISKLEGGGGCEPPEAICKDATVTLVEGIASVSVEDIDDGSTAPCGLQSMSVSPENFSCANIGENTVTLTVTDINGAFATCTSTVTVVGEIPTTSILVTPSPTVAGQLENTIYLGYGPQSVTLTASGETGYTYSWSPSTGLSCTDCAAPVASPTATTPYMITVTNEYGCTATASVLITVIDVRCGNNLNKVFVCTRKGKTKCLSPQAVQAILNQGGTLGPCLKSAIAMEDGPTDILIRNYPNPFNESTFIEYTIPYEANIVLRVYDMFAREVSTLVNTYQEAGKYTVEFDAKDMPGGIYTCTLEAKGELLKRVMIRLK